MLILVLSDARHRCTLRGVTCANTSSPNSPHATVVSPVSTPAPFTASSKVEPSPPTAKTRVCSENERTSNVSANRNPHIDVTLSNPGGDTGTTDVATPGATRVNEPPDARMYEGLFTPVNEPSSDAEMISVTRPRGGTASKESKLHRSAVASGACLRFFGVRIAEFGPAATVTTSTAPLRPNTAT